jgi:magnesium transporter
MVEIFKKVNGELLKIEQPEPDCWVNIYPPFSHENLEAISQQYNIPLDYLTDSLDIDERTRFEQEGDVKLIVINTPIINEEDLLIENSAQYITIPVGIVILKDMILTISPYNNPVVDCFINKRVKNFDPANRGQFVVKLFDRNVFYFLHYLKQINNKRNLYEEELFNSSRNKELSQLMNLQKSLVYFVTDLRSNELTMMKIQRTDFLELKAKPEVSDFLKDVIVDNSQALEMSNIYTNILNGTMDAFASIISNNLNMVMKRLTSFTILLMVPNIFAGFYGMNVLLPLQDKAWAFSFIFLLSLFISGGAAYYFYRKKWF